MGIDFVTHWNRLDELKYGNRFQWVGGKLYFAYGSQDATRPNSIKRTHALPVVVAGDRMVAFVSQGKSKHFVTAEQWALNLLDRALDHASTIPNLEKWVVVFDKPDSAFTMKDEERESRSENDKLHEENSKEAPVEPYHPDTHLREDGLHEPGQPVAQAFATDRFFKSMRSTCPHLKAELMETVVRVAAIQPELREIEVVIDAPAPTGTIHIHRGVVRRAGKDAFPRTKGVHSLAGTPVVWGKALPDGATHNGIVEGEVSATWWLMQHAGTHECVFLSGDSDMRPLGYIQAERPDVRLTLVWEACKKRQDVITDVSGQLEAIRSGCVSPVLASAATQSWPVTAIFCGTDFTDKSDLFYQGSNDLIQRAVWLAMTRFGLFPLRSPVHLARFLLSYYAHIKETVDRKNDEAKTKRCKTTLAAHVVDEVEVGGGKANPTYSEMLCLHTRKQSKSRKVGEETVTETIVRVIGMPAPEAVTRGWYRASRLWEYWRTCQGKHDTSYSFTSDMPSWLSSWENSVRQQVPDMQLATLLGSSNAC